MRIGVAIVLFVLLDATTSSNQIDQQLAAALAQHGFTGRIESTLERRLGRNWTINSSTSAGYSSSIPSAD